MAGHSTRAFLTLRSWQATIFQKTMNFPKSNALSLYPEPVERGRRAVVSNAPNNYRIHRTSFVRQPAWVILLRKQYGFPLRLFL